MKLPGISNPFKSSSKSAYMGLVVGAHAVKATIFAPPAELEAAPKILGQFEQKQGLTSMRGNKILDLDAVLETTDLAIEQAQLSAGLSPQAVILGLFGESVKGVGLMVRLKRPKKEIEITSKELGFLLERVKEKTVPGAQKEMDNGQEVENFKHLNTFLTQYKLDGKVVSSPVGLPGEIFEATLVHTFASKEDLETFQLFAKELDLKVMAYLSSSLIWTLPLLNKFSEGILVDMGGEATEVVIFKNGKIFGNRAFSLGGKDITEGIAQKLRLSFDQAEELKLKYAAGLLDQERAGLVREVVSPFLNFWVQGLSVTLKGFKKIVPLPSSFLITGAAAALEEVKSTLLTYPWDKELSFSAFPKFERLDESIICQGFNYVQSLL